LNIAPFFSFSSQSIESKASFLKGFLQNECQRTMSFRPTGEISYFKARDFSLPLETTKNVSFAFLITNRINDFLHFVKGSK